MAATMIDLDEAYRILFSHVRPLETVELPLEEALFRTLAAPVRCDVDQPPFDRAVMDGYAVRSQDVQRVPALLRIVGRVAAGSSPVFKERQVQAPVLQAGEAMQINTGAPLPDGADAVVRVEETEPGDSGDEVQIRTTASPGQFVTRRATYVKAGEIVLRAGIELTPPAIGAAAAAGADRVTVYRKPTVAIFCTGDELVDTHVKPTGAQIRDSNRPLLTTLVLASHATPVVLPTVPDQRDDIERNIREGLNSDMLCITGGVSMGDTDFVPEVLIKCGANLHIHKMAIKPGRPTIFATTEEGRLIFALPGNPASAFIGFTLLVRPALDALQGRSGLTPFATPAVLQGTVKPTGNRRTFLPARATLQRDGRWLVSPLSWQGSGDVFGMAAANALIERPPNTVGAKDGDTVGTIILGRP